MVCSLFISVVSVISTTSVRCHTSVSQSMHWPLGYFSWWSTRIKCKGIIDVCFVGSVCSFWFGQPWSFWWVRRTCNQRCMYIVVLSLTLVRCKHSRWKKAWCDDVWDDKTFAHAEKTRDFRADQEHPLRGNHHTKVKIDHIRDFKWVCINIQQ